MIDLRHFSTCPYLSIPVSEYARRGHPDSFANIVADTIVLRAISKDPDSRIDVGVSVGYNSDANNSSGDIITITGNMATSADLCESEMYNIVASVAKALGYTGSTGFDPGRFILRYNITPQSKEIAVHADSLNAPDSRPCYGYACNETLSYTPKSTALAKAVRDKLDAGIPVSGPDGKVQAVIDYELGKPVPKKVTIHAQRLVDDIEFRKYLFGLIEPVAEGAEITFLPFVKGGPRADKGQSGVKSLMYGESMPAGGGNYHGLDPSKPEWYGTAIARHVAKSVVASGLAERCKVTVAYSMAENAPSVHVESFPEIKAGCVEKLTKKFPLSPKEAIEEYRLRSPSVVGSVISGGFIGNDALPWERVVEL